MNKYILSVKFSYVRFMSQMWKYVYDTQAMYYSRHILIVDYGFFY